MGKTVAHGNFEWDEEKEKTNILKHRISFSEILPMFDDPLFWERLDTKESTETETRYIGTAKVDGFVVIVSSYTERSGRTRIINARIASKKEEKKYEEWCKQFYA